MTELIIIENFESYLYRMVNSPLWLTFFFSDKSLRSFPFKDYKWKITTNNKLNKTTFWLHCHIYYKTLGSLHFGILYNWFWQWLTWFGLLQFHPREIKHQILCRCVMGQRFTICSAMSDFKDLKKFLSWQCFCHPYYLRYFFHVSNGIVWLVAKILPPIWLPCRFFRRQFSLHVCTFLEAASIRSSTLNNYLLVLPKRLQLLKVCCVA